MRVPIDIPSGLWGDDTTFAAKGRWNDCSNVRFRLGRAQTIGGWESLTLTLLSGVCRAVFPMTDNVDQLTIGFGTHSNLQLWQGGSLVDITPTLALPAATLPLDPFTVTNGSTTFTVNHPGHGLLVGESIIISGALPAGRTTPSGTFAIASVVDANTYTFVNGTAATLARTLGASPLSVVLNSATVTVTDTGHNIETGTNVTIAGATAVGGLTPNGTFPVTVINANSYSFTFSNVASSTATGGGSAVISTPQSTGGGTAVTVTPQRAFTTGNIDGTGSSGYGTGAYGIGEYGVISQAQFFPRTWSFGAWGQNMIASPRGGTIYAWTNDLAQVAQPLANAPAQVTYSLVAPMNGGYMLFALGCSQEADGVFNPTVIRHSGVRLNTQWNTSNTTTSREYTLTGGGRIVAGAMCGEFLLVWTDFSLFIGQFQGSLDAPWTFTEVASNCGLIGPNAKWVKGQTAFWVSPDRQFYSYTLGGQPTPIACPIRDDFSENLAATEGDKIVASSISEFSEIRFDYPDQRDGAGIENSRYLALCIAGEDIGSWYRGQMARTAFVDAGPSQYPIGVTFEGNVYFHEKGETADGGAIQWFIESADQYLDENYTTRANGIWPDIFNQQGPVNVEVAYRFFPQDTEQTTGAMLMAVGAQKVDFRADGRLFRFRFSGNSGPTFARLGKFDVDAIRGGLR